MLELTIDMAHKKAPYMKTQLIILATLMAFLVNPVAAKNNKSKGLPPGLEKNQKRGKPLPPGWQKNYAGVLC